MTDIRNLWTIIMNFLNMRFTLYGYSMSWMNILIYSLFGSLIIGAIVHLFKAHE